MNPALTVECIVHLRRSGKGYRKELQAGPAPQPPVVPSGRVPRVSRLMALALRYDRLLRDGVVADYGALARLGHVTRVRISQILNLVLLAPDIQEALLFLPRTERGRDPIPLHQLQPIARTADWRVQRRLWAPLRAAAYR